MDWRKLFLQPKERREVYKHMTAGEKLTAHMYIAAYAGWIGLTVGFPGHLLRGAIEGSPETLRIGHIAWLLDPPAALGVLLAGIVICAPVVIYFRRKLREHLASTEWARSQGYTVDDL